jgi:hypothetical protein
MRYETGGADPGQIRASISILVRDLRAWRLFSVPTLSGVLLGYLLTVILE